MSTKGAACSLTCSEAGKKGGRARGKQLKGEGNPNAKLTPEHVAQIKRARKFVTAEGLGRAYNVHPEHIRKIWRGEYWNG